MIINMMLCDLGRVIAAVKNSEDFDKALSSKVKAIFDLSPDLLEIAQRAAAAHNADKKYFVHIDLATGIGKDKSGVFFVKKIGADGIISTRSNIIKIAKELSLPAIQRFFAVDSKSLETAVNTVKSLEPDMIEVLPGICAKAIKVIKSQTGVPVIAGGLVEEACELEAAVNSGACAVSTGKDGLWNI